VWSRKSKGDAETRMGRIEAVERKIESLIVGFVVLNEVE
jgi:hypothetical protein